MKFVYSKKIFILIMTLMCSCVVPVHSAVYTYMGTANAKNGMQAFTAKWNDSDSNLSLSSRWNGFNNKKIDQASFLINDGGVPDTTKYTEQFLFYDLDLIKNVVQVREYYGDRVLGTYEGLINSKTNSYELTFDNSILGLNEKSFLDQGRYFQDNLFGEQIGVWHYLYSDGSLAGAHDVHNADTVELPVTQTWVLLLLGLIILTLSKRLDGVAAY